MATKRFVMIITSYSNATKVTVWAFTKPVDAKWPFCVIVFGQFGVLYKFSRKFAFFLLSC